MKRRYYCKKVQEEKRREYEQRRWLSMVRDGNDRMKSDKKEKEIKSWIEQTETLRDFKTN